MKSSIALIIPQLDESREGITIASSFAVLFFRFLIAINDEAFGYWQGEIRGISSFLARAAVYHGAGAADGLVHQATEERR